MDTHLQFITLNNGVKIPKIGFGAYLLKEGEETVEAVGEALKAGYRSIDTASLYGNEKNIGQAIRESLIPREDIFVTTKVGKDEQGYDNTLKAFENSLDRLQMSYIDLYLIHWPVPDKSLESYRALEKLYKEGKIRAIGVSNFNIHHLETLLSFCEIPPTVNQMELHPLLSQEPLRRFCIKHKIQIEAWSPLMRGGKIMDNDIILRMAEEYGKTPAQIILRWHYQHNIIAIPKSKTPSRIRENIDIFDFQLSESHMEIIDHMNVDLHIGINPDDVIRL